METPEIKKRKQRPAPTNGAAVLHHILQERGLTDAQITLQGLRYLSAEEHATLMGYPKLDVPGILIPYADADGHIVGVRTKLIGEWSSKPNKKPARYLQRQGTGNRLYLARGIPWKRVLNDPTQPLIITEGELKAIKLCQEGYNCIALSGVWNWLSKEDDLESSPITDLMDIDWRERRTFIVFDSDARVKKGVRAARDALVAFLFNEGARPFVLELPRVAGLKKTGIDDWFVALKKEAKQRFDELLAKARSKLVLDVHSHAEVQEMTIKASEQFTVDGLLPRGLVLLAGKPKVRKSFLALHLGHCVATGKHALGLEAFKVNQGRVLYLALEDNPQRMQKRSKMMRQPAAPDFDMAFSSPRGTAGIELISRWCEQRPNAKLVIIDTLAKFRAVSDGRRSAYDVDYAELTELKDLAEEHNVTVLVVHHERKGYIGDDVLESVSGTFAITGGVDTILVLRRQRLSDEATLHVVARDLDDAEWALKFEDGTWSWLGDAGEVLNTKMEAQVLEALKQAPGGKPLGPLEVTQFMGRTDRGNISRVLKNLVERRAIEWCEGGKYKMKELH